MAERHGHRDEHAGDGGVDPRPEHEAPQHEAEQGEQQRLFTQARP